MSDLRERIERLRGAAKQAQRLERILHERYNYIDEYGIPLLPGDLTALATTHFLVERPGLRRSIGKALQDRSRSEDWLIPFSDMEALWMADAVMAALEGEVSGE